MKLAIVAALVSLLAACATGSAPESSDAAAAAAAAAEAPCENGNTSLYQPPPDLGAFERAQWIGKTVQYSYDVVEGGVAENLRVVESGTTPEVTEEVTRTVSQWRFKLLLKEGQVVRQKDCSIVVDLSAALRKAWVTQISDRIKRNWTRPANTPRNFGCKVQIEQSAAGKVLRAALVQSCGSAALDKSVVTAVQKSSPLPLPPDPSLFEPTVIFNFVP
jgi:TonB family protein